MSNSCVLYGLKVRADCPLPGLPDTSPSAAADVRVRLAAGLRTPQHKTESWYASSYLDADGRPALKVEKLPGGDWFRFAYSQGSEFLLDREGTEVWVSWTDPATLSDAVSFLSGAVMGFLLRLRGVTSLHASAISVGGRTIALIGDCGAGKSTTAAAFARLGHPIVSDDVVPLIEVAETFLAQSGYPRIKLWPSSVEALAHVPSDLPALPSSPVEGRLHLDLTRDGYQFQHAPQPLAAVYFLSGSQTAARRPRVESLSPRDAFLKLIAHSYASALLDGPMRSRDFEQLGRLVERVPVRRVAAPHDARRLSELCDAILRDAQDLISTEATDCRLRAQRSELCATP